MSSYCSELRRARPLLGTFVDIRAGAEDRGLLAAAIDAAFHEIAHVHRLMSFHDSASDVSRINRDAWRAAIPVHPHTMQVLRLAREFSEATGGAFDVTVASHMVERGILPLPPGTPELESANWNDLDLLADGRVQYRRPLLVDLGGIAKGYAVDLAIAALRRNGAAWGCVNAGGDLRVFGRPQAVHVRHPLAHWQSFPLTEVNESAVATSAAYFADRHRSTILNPRTATPATGALSVTVAAARCVVADALTKVVHLLGDTATELMRAHGASAWIIDGESAKCDDTVFA